MALPARDKTFALENCRDLLSKLDREIDRFTDPVTSFTECLDLSFNIVVTAWHLCDWVFSDMTRAQRDALKIKDLVALQNFVSDDCRYLHLCRQAATASKHWRVDRRPDDGVSVIVQAGVITAANPPAQSHDGWYIYFTDGPKIIGAESVFELVISYWTQFIYQNDIARSDGSCA